MNEKTAVLGAHIAAGLIWFAAVSDDGGLVADSADRLELADLPNGRGLSELEESIEAVLNRVDPGKVVLLDAGSSKRPPSPSTVRKRAWLESALMIASARTNRSVSTISHASVKTLLGVGPTAPDFKTQMAERLNGDTPTRWSDRAPAFGAALAELQRGKK